MGGQEERISEKSLRYADGHSSQKIIRPPKICITEIATIRSSIPDLTVATVHRMHAPPRLGDKEMQTIRSVAPSMWRHMAMFFGQRLTLNMKSTQQG